MSWSPAPAVSVIIRTLAEGRRRDAIYRALQSIVSQQGVTAIPIVVANGDRFDPTLLEELQARRDLRFHYLELGSLPAAMQQGRAMVDTPFFCYSTTTTNICLTVSGARGDAWGT